MYSIDEFNNLKNQGYNLIPLHIEYPADLDTALSIYLKLANQPYTCLLESVQGGERFARYSFVGLSAKTRLEVKKNQIKRYEYQTCIEDFHHDQPLDYIQNYFNQFKVAIIEKLPRFSGGLIGYFGYETIRYIEPRLAKTEKKDVLNVPDILLLLCTELVIIDNVTSTLHLLVYVDPNQENAYEQGVNQLNQLQTRLDELVAINNSRAYHIDLNHKNNPIETPLVSEFGEEAYKSAITQAKNYIHDGDIMQVVLSQRMIGEFNESPLALYRALRRLNPSPYMFYFNLDQFYIVGASPELLVRLEQNTVTVRPIAGTRPRGKTPQEDLALAEDLLADPKELAEHVMLIDLGRNDVGRVSQIGTVNVTEKMVIENYSHVMHIVSNVEGKLKENLKAIDVIKATFPAGTLSGAPKIRAMEIIDELEPTDRGIYGGAVGYLSFNGDMDLAIAIRTAVIKNKQVYVQAGAGIVMDSIPQNEWDETQNKAKAVMKAIELIKK